MNKGFAITGVLYSVLILFLVITSVMLFNMQNKKTLLDKLKTDTINAVESDANYDYLLGEINSLKTKVKNLEDANTSLRTDLTTANSTITQLTNTLNTTTSNVTQVGTIIAYSKNATPSGYLQCNGQAVSRTTYQALFNVIGTTYGSGNGSTTFNVPDLRGEFLRGWSTAARDTGSGGSVGQHQDATRFQSWYMTGSNSNFEFWNGDSTYSITTYDKQISSTNIWHIMNSSRYDKTNEGSNATRPNKVTSRPTNTSVMYAIKY